MEGKVVAYCNLLSLDLFCGTEERRGKLQEINQCCGRNSNRLLPE